MYAYTNQIKIYSEFSRIIADSFFSVRILWIHLKLYKYKSTSDVFFLIDRVG